MRTDEVSKGSSACRAAADRAQTTWWLRHELQREPGEIW